MSDCEKHGPLYECCPDCTTEHATAAERARIIAKLRERVKALRAIRVGHASDELERMADLLESEGKP